MYKKKYFVAVRHSNVVLGDLTTFWKMCSGVPFNIMYTSSQKQKCSGLKGSERSVILFESPPLIQNNNYNFILEKKRPLQIKMTIKQLKLTLKCRLANN